MSFGAAFGRKSPVLLDTEEAMELWQAGATDEEIMQACNVTIETVRKFRRLRGLSVNAAPKKPKKRGRTLTKLEQDAIAARKAGMSYGQWKAQQEYWYGKR